MATKFVALTKTNKEIIETICENTIKMLAERKFIDKKNIEKYMAEMIDKINKDKVYELKSDTLDDTYVIKLFLRRVGNANNVPELVKFFNDYSKQHKILIVSDDNEKASKVLEFDNTEVFFSWQLMMNMIEHVSVPKHTPLDENKKKEFFDSYNVKKNQCPQIYTEDKVAKYYNLQSSDVVRIVRPSEISGYGVIYRYAVDKK
jgi:DNA-directed RNA polymerase subunit H (RpoH/RPB5)